MEKIDKAIEILQAFKEGKTVQYLECSKWRDFIEGNIFSVLSHYICRIKPQLTYRPYANAEEFLKASKEHGGYLRTKSYGLEDDCFIPDRINCNGIIWLTRRLEWRLLTYEGLLRDYVWMEDSQPCGILE